MNSLLRRHIGRATVWMGMALIAIVAGSVVPRTWAQPAQPAALPAHGDKSTVILDCKDTNWRWFKTWRPAVVIDEANGAERTTLHTKKPIDAKAAETLELDVPAGYSAADFDDTAWPRTAGRWLDPVAFETEIRELKDVLAPNTTLAILRGRFKVTDASAVKSLALSLKYRGGVVVYLNGREITRRDLPAGALTGATPATPYPPEAYVDAAGKVLPAGAAKPDEKDLAERIAKRDRTLDGFAIPPDQLRAGTNVLVIEVHRSDYLPAANLAYRKGDMELWGHCAILDINLSAEGAGIMPNASRPAGVQVWNQDRNDRTTVADYGDPNETLRPIMLTGARNGFYSGKVVVSSDQPMEKVRGDAGDLKTVNGAALIPAAALRVEYSVATPTVIQYYTSPWIEPLSANAPDSVPVEKAFGAVQPIWLSVHVPKDAPPGDYQGTLAVSVAGAKIADVPVRLHVGDGILPEPSQFKTFVGLSESPTTLAYQYKVDEWSEKHWELLDKSLQLLGGLGNQAVEIPVVEETRVGNLEGMVYWIKKADGTYDHDFSIVAQYLKLVKKDLGVPKFVVFHVWHGGGWKFPGPKQENTVTVVNADGSHAHLQVPEFGTEAARKFWEPVFKGLKECLAKEGMEKSLCLGNLAEGFIREQAVNKMFADLLGPDDNWMMITHRMVGRMEDPHPPMDGGGNVDYHIFTYLPDLPEVATPDKVPSIFKTFWPRVAYFRRAIFQSQSLIAHREFGLHARFLGLPGFAYMGLDFWPVTTPDGKKMKALYGRFVRSGLYPGDPEPYYITWPGPGGAEPMTGYEAMREGLQETEALVTISEGVDSGKLDPELVQRCQRVLFDELEYLRTRDVLKYQYTYFHVNYYGWQEMSGRAYALAAEVSHKLGR